MIRTLNHATLRGVGPLEAAAAAAAGGFEGIGLWAQDLPPPGAELNELRSRLPLAVTEIDVVAPYMYGDRKEEGRAELRRAARIAAALGAPVVVTAPAFGAGDPAEAGEDLRAAAETVAEEGPRLAIEPICLVEQFTDLRCVLELVDRAGSDAAVVCFDTFHAAVAGTAPAEIAGAAGRVAIVHVADAPDLPRERLLEPHKHRVLPGLGVQPVREYLAALGEAGYKGSLAVDVFSEELWERDPDEVAREALVQLESLLSERKEKVR